MNGFIAVLVKHSTQLLMPHPVFRLICLFLFPTFLSFHRLFICYPCCDVFLSVSVHVRLYSQMYLYLVANIYLSPYPKSLSSPLCLFLNISLHMCTFLFVSPLFTWVCLICLAICVHTFLSWSFRTSTASSSPFIYVPRSTCMSACFAFDRYLLICILRYLRLRVSLSPSVSSSLPFHCI